MNEKKRGVRMRYFLLLLHVTVVGALITAVCALGTASANHSNTEADFGLIEFILTVGGTYLLGLLHGISIFAGFAPAVATLQPFLVFFVVSMICAFLSGYRYFVRVKWIGFAMNLSPGLLALLVTLGRFTLIIFFIAVFYLACAFLFFKAKCNADANDIRRSVSWLQIFLWATGAVVFFGVSRNYGGSQVIGTILALIPFFLHYRVITAFKFNIKEGVKLILIMALTFVSLIVIIFALPVFFGPLLVSWFSVGLYMEALFLSPGSHELVAEESKCLE
jgi:hypothetical protein